MEGYFCEFLRCMSFSYKTVHAEFDRLEKEQQVLIESMKSHPSLQLKETLLENATKLDDLDQNLRNIGKFVCKVRSHIMALRHNQFFCLNPKDFKDDHYELFMKNPRDWVVESDMCTKCGTHKKDCVYVKEGCTPKINCSCSCYNDGDLHEWCSFCLYEYVSEQLKTKRVYSLDPDDVTCEIKCHKCQGSVCPYMFIPCKTEDPEPILKMPSSLSESSDEKVGTGTVSVSADRQLNEIRHELSDIKNMFSSVFKKYEPKWDPPSKDGNEKLRTISCKICNQTWPARHPEGHYSKKCPKLKELASSGKDSSEDANVHDTNEEGVKNPSFKKQKMENGAESKNNNNSSDHELGPIILTEDILGRGNDDDNDDEEDEEEYEWIPIII